jgi:glycosyltransferase involved in cell wall biosynthesis
MRIGIDLSILGVNQAGTASYTRRLLTALEQLKEDIEIKTFAVKQNRDMSAPKSIQSRFDTLYRDILWIHGILPLQARRAKVDILHMPAFIIPLRCPCPSVVSILDTTIYRNPEYFPVWQRTYLRSMLPHSAHRSKKIITISKQSKNDIITQFGVPPDKVVPTYLAASLEFKQLPEDKITDVKKRYHLERFILIVGTLEPRKNLKTLLKSFGKIKDTFPDVKLVHAGPQGWLYEEVLIQISENGLESSVTFLGRIPLDDLVGLYNAAEVFVFPSLYEGFGLPVLEAMACGCPVITSNVSSLPEVAGDAAILVNPINDDMIAHQLNMVLSDPELREHLRQQGLAQARRFSWQRCAEETLKVYREFA